MPITQAQKTELEALASTLETQVAALVVDPDAPSGPTQEEYDAAVAQRDAALAHVLQLQQRIDFARTQLCAAVDADAAEDAARAGALQILEG